ncbi:hypothetical protein WMY93_012296 [Mugilogobius chulae]|uniref:DH domain-containing protein n=1 Tax=Mugilogobius chulae TaxID=88201 RepID=A0AAW0P518_9GOBI
MAESENSDKDHKSVKSQLISNMCSRLQNNLSGNGFMSQLNTVKLPEQLSSRFRHESSDAEPDSSKPDHSPSTDSPSSLKSTILTQTVDFDKIFSAVGKLLFDPSEEINQENEKGSDSNEEQVKSARFRSKFLHNLPLYQDYCLHNVRDDIQRLKNSSLSEFLPQSVQDQLPSGPRWSCSLLHPPTPIKVTPSTLWQDLEEVKASGVLCNLTPREIRLHETSFELICSEASYMRSLEIAVKHFYASKTLKQTLTNREHHILFSNIQRVMVASEKFLVDLELVLGECLLVGSQIGDVVLRHCPVFHRLYTILKLTKPETDSFKQLEKAIQAIHELVQECDNRVRKMKQIEQLVCLEMLLVFGKVKVKYNVFNTMLCALNVMLFFFYLPVVNSSGHKRTFPGARGSSEAADLANSGHSRQTFTNIYLHLLSDILIISTKRDEHFKVHDHAEFPTHIRCESLKAEVLGLPPNSFLLHLSKRQTGEATVLILVTDTKSAKETWMNALSSKK